MYRLYLDTANHDLVVMITNSDNKIIHSFVHNAQQKQTELAVPTINDILKASKLTLPDINELVITIGPGSYTGIRVALTFAKTLKTLNEKLQIWTLNSLLLQAGLQKAISVITGYSNKSYLAVYDAGRTIINPQLVTDEALNGMVSDLKDYQVLKDFAKNDSIKNFLLLQSYWIKIKTIDDLQPLYIEGNNFQKIVTE